jgi:PAS domain S-box-containing protein
MTAGRELEAARQVADRGTASAGLPRLVASQAALVLLVDLTAGTVTYANDRARQLAPAANLPISVHDWSASAGLQTPDGRELESSESPLARIAAGQPVRGEEVSAARASDSTAQREPLWVVGLPLEGAPGPLDRQALVVFLPLRARSDVDVVRGAGVEALQSRAISATGLAFTISDPHADDNPLIWVNPAFLLETGYAEEEVIGRNCRFLQGPETDREAVARVREALAAERPITEVLLNYRKDGTTFWNEVTISPVYDGEGRLANFVGVQADVTVRVLAERASAESRELARRALDAERDARKLAEAARTEADEAARSAEQAVLQAEETQRILSLLAETTTVLAATLDVQEALSRLAGLLVPMLGDWVAINLVDDGGHLTRATMRHRDGHEERLERLADLQYVGLAADAPLRRAVESRKPLLVSALSPDQAAGWMTPEMIELAAPLGLGSAIYVPLIARRRVLGAIALFGADRGRFDERHLEVVQEIARRAALMVDNARLYDQEHQAALTLQRSMLSAVPDVPGLDITALYVPGNAGAEIGGDWYDVMPLPNGATALAVGDVMGHDIAAAAAMGQVRSVLRAYAFEGGGPARVVQRVDQLVQGLGVVPLATCCYATLDPGHGLTWTNAGHLPPLLRRPDGTVTELRIDDPDVVIGAAPPDLPRVESSIDLPVGSVLVMFTDGLVEGRNRDIGEGVADVSRILAGHDPAAGSAALAARLNEYADGPDREDDICLLVVHVQGS